jgi:hypothetical protein
LREEREGWIGVLDGDKDNVLLVGEELAIVVRYS